MQILNQPTEPTTKTIEPFSDINEKVNAFFQGVIAGYSIPITEEVLKATRDAHIDAISKNFTHQNSCSDELAYWLYNKDVPIPKLPKCVSSRIHAPSRGWRNGGKGKTAPILDSGWNKEKA